MFTLYTWSTPNGQKASIMLEELSVPYTVTPINIGKGHQHRPEYRQVSPNGKIPALTLAADNDSEDSEKPPQRIFESGNILIFLAEKYGKLLPESGTERTEVLGWLFFQVGHLGPIIGQWHWFNNAAPATSELGIKRYREESLRLLEVLNGRLGEVPFLGGETYSIADIANYPWSAAAADELANEPMTADAVAALESLQDWLKRVGGREAVQRGMDVPSDEQKQATESDETIAGPASGGTVLP